MADIEIALIEDDKVLSKVMTEEMEDAGFTVHQAFDGEEGVAIVKQKMPDLILLDLIMPKKHGFDVLRELKADPETARIPVNILTMLGNDDDVKKGLTLGAEDYIVKSQHAISECVDKIGNFCKENLHSRPAKQPKQKPESE